MQAFRLKKKKRKKLKKLKNYRQKQRILRLNRHLRQKAQDQILEKKLMPNHQMPSEPKIVNEAAVKPTPEVKNNYFR